MSVDIKIIDSETFEVIPGCYSKFADYLIETGFYVKKGEQYFLIKKDEGLITRYRLVKYRRQGDAFMKIDEKIINFPEELVSKLERMISSEVKKVNDQKPLFSVKLPPSN